MNHRNMLGNGIPREIKPLEMVWDERWERNLVAYAEKAKKERMEHYRQEHQIPALYAVAEPRCMDQWDWKREIDLRKTRYKMSWYL